MGAARRALRPVTARPTVAVSVLLDWDRLRADLPGSGTLSDGTLLSPAAALAAGFDAGIIPMVFDSLGRPLHVGWATRGFTRVVIAAARPDRHDRVTMTRSWPQPTAALTLCAAMRQRVEQNWESARHGT